MRRLFKSRRGRYGSLTVVLTVAVVVATILLDTAFMLLCTAKGWSIDMSGENRIYELSDEGADFMREAVLDKLGDGKITVTLCDEQRTLMQDGASAYVLGTVLDIKESFGDKVVIEHLNIFEDPTRARELGVSSTTDIAFSCKGRSVALSLAQCYAFTDGETEIPSAYIGERRILTSMLSVAGEGARKCCFTVNHGETADAELIYLLADSGYTSMFIDLFEDDIPEDCELLVTVNPTQDLSAVADGERVSEAHKIENYMRTGGKYMVFVGVDTFLSGGFENFEGLLEDWGVRFAHSTGTDGREDCYAIKDPVSSVTTDGYTVFSEIAENSFAQSVLGECKRQGVFGAATAIQPAESFAPTADGGYESADGKRMYPVLTSTDSAQAWADGRLVQKAKDGRFAFMTVTELEGEGGKGTLVACSSLRFVEEGMLQSIVYGNGEMMMRVLAHLGAEDLPYALSSRPLSPLPIQSLTGRSSIVITVCLAVLPALCVATVGTVVLVRRKRA